MGKLTVTLWAGDQRGSRSEDIEVAVDTGATFTAVHVYGGPSGKGSRSLTTAWESRFTAPRNFLSPHRLLR